MATSIFVFFLMICNPKYHISIIFQVKVEQNTLEIIEIVSQMNVKMAQYFLEVISIHYLKNNSILCTKQKKSI